MFMHEKTCVIPMVYNGSCLILFQSTNYYGVDGPFSLIFGKMLVSSLLVLQFIYKFIMKYRSRCILITIVAPFQFNNVQVGPSMSYWHASCFVIIFVADLLN